MEKHLLLAVTSAKSTERAVRFVARFFARPQDIRLTLASFYSRGPLVWEHEKNHATLQERDDRQRAALADCQAGLERTRQRLARARFDPDKLEPKCFPRDPSQLKRLMCEAEQGLFDAVILGSQETAELKDLGEQDLSRALLGELVSFPIWICPRTAPENSGVLVCVDGSDPSNRVVDHVGFMLADEPEHDIHLLHVKDPAKEEPGHGQAVLQEALGMLRAAGLPDDRIHLHLRRGASASRVILEHAADMAPAAVAMGSTGADRGFFKRLLFGSVSLTALEQLCDTALWICR